MHGEDHRGRGAGTAERVAHLGDVEDRGAEAAELDRDLRAEQLALAGGVDCGLGEACLEVDVFGIGGSCGRDGSGALLEGGAAVEQLLAAFIRSTKYGFLDVHGLTRSDFFVVVNAWAPAANAADKHFLSLRFDPKAMDLIQMRR